MFEVCSYSGWLVRRICGRRLFRAPAPPIHSSSNTCVATGAQPLATATGDGELDLTDSVCFQCFQDKYLSAQVKTEGEPDLCRVCGKVSESITIERLGEILEPIMRDNFAPGRQVPEFDGSDQLFYSQLGDPISYWVQEVLGQYFDFEDEMGHSRRWQAPNIFCFGSVSARPGRRLQGKPATRPAIGSVPHRLHSNIASVAGNITSRAAETPAEVAGA